MISVNLPSPLEKHLRNIVRDNYDGNLHSAIRAFLKLHEKYGWKEQLLEDVKSIRSKVREKGGVKEKTIDDAISKHRKKIGSSDG